MTDTNKPRLAMTTLDCADAASEATFWSEFMGWEVAAQGEGYAMLSLPGGGAVGFGTVPDYEPPAWPNPNGSKQFHFDLACSDIQASEASALSLGASLADPQPGETWRVLLSPGGHPFCLTDAANW